MFAALRFCDLINFEQSPSASPVHNSCGYPTATATFLLPLRTSEVMESAMYVHFTNIQVIIGGFALFLIIIFALAAFLDRRWRISAPPRAFGSDHKTNFLQQSSSRDEKDGSSNLYTRYADLSARSLGTDEQPITLRGEKQQSLAGD
jgi:hypothetical protein